MSIVLKIYVFCVMMLSKSESARILAVFPIPSISHQIVFRPITQELARRGHDVVVVTPDPAFPKGQTPPNLTEIDVHDISHKVWHDYFVVAMSKGSTDNLMNQVTAITKLSILLVEDQLREPEVQRLIKDKENKFDLLLLEACVKPALVFSHIYKAPVIQISSFGHINGNYESVGAPLHPLLYPTIFRQKLTNLSLWDKITEFYNNYRIESMFQATEKVADVMLKRLIGSDVPPLSKLMDNIDMLFLNMHPVFEGIRPVPPSVVYMGGLHQKEEKELPTDLKSYLDSSKHGVIYLSFGTNVDTSLLPTDKVQAFVRVFSQLPYDVLWKWNGDELPGRTDNIRISKWLPQSDLLRHPKIKLFITQGGLQSTDEAITAGVPLIGVPMLADQWYNTEKYLLLKIGLKVDMETLTEQQLTTAIQTVINDISYRRNVVRLRGLMADQPQPPLERAVWWIEHVLRHGGARHLRAPAANMPWTQYFEIELVLTVLGLLGVIITVFTIVLYYTLKMIYRKNPASDKVKKH